MGTYIIVAAEFRSEGVAFEILMNGALAMTDRDAIVGHHFVKLNPWIIEGENTLSVRLALPDGATAPGGNAAFELRVVQGEHGQPPGPEGLLLEFFWSPALSPPLGPDFMDVFAGGPRPGQSHGRWSWEDATPFTPAERPDVESLVTKLHAALERRDVVAASALFEIHDAEMDRALDLPPGSHAAVFRAQLNGVFSAPDFRMEPLDAERLVLTPRSGGRLVDVRGPSGAPAVRGSGSGGPIELAFAVSRVAGGPRMFSIVR